MAHTQVYLKRGKSRPIHHGHPWIFSGAIQRVEAPVWSDLVEVFDEKENVLGWGFFSLASDIRVRMTRLVGPELSVESLASAFRSAWKRREMLGLGRDTDVYRWVNSEGDGLPGITVDRVGDVAVLQLNTFPTASHVELVADALLASTTAINAVVRAPAPELIVKKEMLVDGEGWLRGERRDSTIVRENGVQFRVDWDTFQKTGHYADMREHREWIASLASGASLLDAYSYTGGFGLQAAAQGAQRVVCVDSSDAAIARVEENAELNGFMNVEGVASRVDDYLRSGFDRGERFDIIILDPPKLAPSKKHTKKALKVYDSLAIQATRLLAPGGLLAIGSCSEAIGQREIERVLGSASARCGRTFSVVRSGIQSADHPYPAAMPQGHYLTFVAAMAD